MSNEIVAWPPVLWTLRICLVILFAGGSFIALLYLARFFRPKHIRRLVTADLPAFRKVGGTAKLMGQELAINAELDSERDKQLTNLYDRLVTMEEGFDSLSKSVGSVIAEVRTFKEGHDVTSTEERRRVTEGGARAPGESQGNAG